ncbi:MAG: hypothetical protein ACR2N2_05540 [Acidimicrobiia bacterium]
MAWFGVALGLLFTFTGVVWLFQGLGATFVPQSFMTNSITWIIIGSVTAAIGVVLTWRSVMLLRQKGQKSD